MQSKIVESLISCNRSELASLFSNEHKASLLHNISSLKEEHSEDEVVSLIWCYVQAEGRTIPISFIAGTISEKLSSAELIKRSSSLCSIVYIKVAEMLQEENEHRLCLLLLDPIFKCFSCLDSEYRDQIRGLLDRSIRIELEEAQKRKEDKSYLLYIEHLKSSLSKIAPEQPKSPPKDDVWTLETQNSLIKETELSEPNSSLINHQPISNRVIQSPKSKSPLILIISVVLLLVLIVFFSFGNPKLGFLDNVSKRIASLFSSQTEGTIYAMKLENGSIGPYLPPLPPYSSFEKDGQLDSISERLSNIQSNESTPTSPPTPSPTKSEKIDQDEIESLNVIPESGENIPIKKIPTVAVSTIPAPVDLGSSNKGAPIEEPSPKLKADGKLYGSVTTSDPVAGKSNERSLDGSPLKSYEVQKFDPPELYRTITGTNVLSAPSLMAQSIGRIESGATVRVTSIMGQWTEIRSDAGRLGYIFLKDLKKEEQSLD